MRLLLQVIKEAYGNENYKTMKTDNKNSDSAFLTALRLCQKIGITTMFSDFNEGMTLPLSVSKKIAIAVINEICPATDYCHEVKNEINNL